MKQRVDDVRSALEKLKPQLKMALPKHLTPERLVRVTVTAIQRSPKLLDCDRISLFAAVMSCAQLGLEPDGVLGQAYLIPYGNRVQFIPGYKGYIALARNSGDVISIAAHEVCTADHFLYQYGLEEKLEHRPAEGERGGITHFYAYAMFKDGGHAFEVLPLAAVEKIRDEDSEGYRAFKAKKIKSTPWDSHFVQMGRKTLIRRLANYLPMMVQRAAAIEGAAERGIAGNIDAYGDLVIEGEATEVDTSPAVEGSGAKATLDTLAGDGQGNGKDKPKRGRAKAKPKGPSDAEDAQADAKLAQQEA
ncbi:MAG: recombinase RecT, partial [Planctomycetes bacterium]|nr:recombinase RecT [Planctomycetota bacterium]